MSREEDSPEIGCGKLACQKSSCVLYFLWYVLREKEADSNGVDVAESLEEKKNGTE